MALFYKDSDFKPVSPSVAKLKILLPPIISYINRSQRRQVIRRFRRFFALVFLWLVIPSDVTAVDYYSKSSPILARNGNAENWQTIWSRTTISKYVMLIISALASLCLLIAAASYRSSAISSKLSASTAIEQLQKQTIVLQAKSNRVKVLEHNLEIMYKTHNKTSGLLDSCLDSLHKTLPVIKATKQLEMDVVSKSNQVLFLKNELDACKINLVKKPDFSSAENRITTEFQKTLQAKKNVSKSSSVGKKKLGSVKKVTKVVNNTNTNINP